MSGTALPEAKRAVYPGEYLVWDRPRNACYLTRITRSDSKGISPAAGRKILCCRRRSGLSSGETSGLHTHRVSAIRLASPRRLCYTPWRCVP